VQTELVEQAQRGDREAFGVLASVAVDRLYGIARLILRDAELAQDATQEALVRAWRDLPTLRDVERFDAWLYRLIVRSCADAGRRRRRWRAEVTVLHAEPAEQDRASELADRDELERGLRRLSDAQRSILVLNFYVGLTPSEMADALDIPIGTAKSRLHYALEALRAALAADARSLEGTTEIGEGRTA
jgi:RNA polymerase sigma-70 factor (ECF subfamily)